MKGIGATGAQGERFATGEQKLEVRTGGEQAGKCRYGLLTVIADEQHLLSLQGSLEYFQRLSLAVLKSRQFHNCWQDQFSIAHRGQREENRSVRQRGLDRSHDFQGQPGFAHFAKSFERYQTKSRIEYPCFQDLNVMLTPNQHVLVWRKEALREKGGALLSAFRQQPQSLRAQLKYLTAFLYRVRAGPRLPILPATDWNIGGRADSFGHIFLRSSLTLACNLKKHIRLMHLFLFCCELCLYPYLRP